MAYYPIKTGIGGLNLEEAELLAHSVDIFSLPETEGSLINGATVDYRTASNVNNTGPYEFIIPADEKQYIYLPLTRLEGSFTVSKVTNGVDANIDAQTKANISNLYSAALFSQVECYIDNTQIIDLSSPTYPWKAYIECMLSFSDDVKQSHLQSALFYEDTAGHFETLGDGNNAYTKRRELFTEGKEVFFSTPLFIDLFQTTKLFPPGFSMKLRLLRSKPSFGLLYETADNVTFESTLKSLRLYMRKVTVTNNILHKHQKLFDNRNKVFLPHPMTKIRQFTIPAQLTSHTITNIVNGPQPTTVIVMFIDSEGFSGSNTKSPFLFHHFNINYLSLKVDGIPHPTTPFQPDWDKNKFVREYRHMIDSCGISHENISNGLTLDKFKKGSFFTIFDLTPDQCNSFHNHASILQSTVNIDLDVGFKEALTNPITALIYTSREGGMFLEKFKNPKLSI